jgi:hypothetical protein
MIDPYPGPVTEPADEAPATPPAPPKVKVKVGIVLPPPGDDPRRWLVDGAAFEAAGADALSIDCGTELDPVPLAAALIAVTYRTVLLVRIAEPVPDRARATLERLGPARLTLVTDEVDPSEWHTVPAPENRAAWRATVADAVERGVPGVLVPADPRMLDLLRNPDEEGDRRDLLLAQG